MQIHTDPDKICRTAGRVLSILLFILWGSIFLNHLSWFFMARMDIPPVRMWFGQISHFLLLVGYLVSLRWERVGSLLVVVNSIFFFGNAAGRNALPFIIVSMFPVMLYAYCWMKHKPSNARQQ